MGHVAPREARANYGHVWHWLAQYWTRLPLVGPTLTVLLAQPIAVSLREMLQGAEQRG